MADGLNKLLISSFLIVILSLFVYKLKYPIHLFLKKKHFLIIGILSAPENVHQRQSVRKTWMQLLSEISGSAYFVIGNQICEVPPLDRVDPYSCIDKPFKVSQNITLENEFSTIRTNIQRNELKTYYSPFIGFTFYVRSRIVVKKLGVLKKLLEIHNREIQVKLISAFDNKVLASVTFSSETLNETSSNILMKAIHPITLVPGFEAVVKLETKNRNISLFPNCDFVSWENKANIINYIQLWQHDSVMPRLYTRKSCPLIFMMYSILDLEKVREVIENRNARKKEWQEFSKKLSYQLQNESRTYNDLMFLDVTDVYRNLSMKIVKFFKRIVQTEDFLYVLKTDDDSFVDLLRVHHQLKKVCKETNDVKSDTVGSNEETETGAQLRLSKFWWWSSFKEFWKVERTGKWREDQYLSASYPTFPCGGGYVVNEGIVDYVASNEHINYFQGEDVSMGIWLSALPVIQYKTPKVIPEKMSYSVQKTIIKNFQGEQSWRRFKSNKKIEDLASNACEWTCDNKKMSDIPFCNKVQLSIEDMYKTWKEFTANGFL